MPKQEAGEATRIRRDTVRDEDATYTYTLLVSESGRVATYKLPLYSVIIEMERTDGTSTRADSGELFADLGKATVFYERLVENRATPLNLPYIIEDSITP